MARSKTGRQTKAGGQSEPKGKQRRDPEATKARILAAATQEFANYGLAGAKTSAIATKSNVTKAMLCYYFDNKETLYRAVLQGLVNDINAAFHPVDWAQQSPAQALESIVRAYLSFESKNRWHGMLWFQEAIQNQGRYGEETGWQTGFKSIVEVLEQGVAQQKFRPLDTFFTTINILGICSFYFDAHENLKYLDPEKELLHPETVSRQTEEVVRFILAGVAVS